MARKTKKRKDSGARYTAETRQKAIRLAKRKVSVPAIARELKGPSEKTIRTWLREAGIQPPGRQRRYDRKKILKDLNATKSDGTPKYSRTELCNKYGCTRKYLSDLATGKIQP